MRRYETPEVEILLFSTEPIMAFDLDIRIGIFPGKNSIGGSLPGWGGGDDSGDNTGEDNALPEDSFEKP